MNWTDPVVLSSIIQAVAVIVAAVVAGLLGKEIANRKKLQCKLVTASQDIEFLLAVEAMHCENNVASTGSSHKVHVRTEVRKRDKNLRWSGQFTPGRANGSETLKSAKLACAIPD